MGSQCPYFNAGHCNAGGRDSGPCTLPNGPHQNCFVYQYQTTGDVSSLYSQGMGGGMVTGRTDRFPTDAPAQTPWQAAPQPPNNAGNYTQPNYGAGGYAQPNYAPGGYVQPFASQNSAQQLEGEKAARTSLILGIVSLFILGVFLGPFAIAKAKQAEGLGANATAGKVLGWIGLVGGVIAIIFLL